MSDIDENFYKDQFHNFYTMFNEQKESITLGFIASVLLMIFKFLLDWHTEFVHKDYTHWY